MPLPDRTVEGFGPLPRHEIAAKLREMELYDATGDARDEGWMDAIQELQDWLAEGAPSVDS